MSRISKEEWRDHVADMMHDTPIYLEKAAQECPCKASGSGEVAFNQAELKNHLLFALMQAAGARTSHTFPGDACPYCGGVGIDLKAASKIAAQRMADDWWITINEDLFPPS